MATADSHKPYALLHLTSGVRLYATCACRQEIRAANQRLHRDGLPLRYVPQLHKSRRPGH